MLRPLRSAKASCEHPAARRCRLSNSAKADFRGMAPPISLAQAPGLRAGGGQWSDVPGRATRSADSALASAPEQLVCRRYPLGAKLDNVRQEGFAPIAD